MEMKKMNEEKYRKNVEKMTDAEFVSFINEKLQETVMLEKILNEIRVKKYD